ncbi:hypothetical protein TVAG_126030 [Trichomonas vaginalis G3]|uniref:Peptidase C14 caspase domain-containing protein n=1 Tax=Trichomonas vaginalis (strain ATCC PRA-98 / G3) TaxID=412133 RepID=A2ECZ1_TRIV3|nr:cysteine-type peptidase protein [Trichomonas vaginalis G3]EAY09442.1 hypothetical protein TVAG_126030 [Trichomonas vaginalis G3]KAI5500662.1 cysteine-type peptidase protein [Trichomonas vaginalis G3]|eukprot:XP_001321665.1 hypothetical protein [Trichomonas vaginalis G3]
MSAKKNIKKYATEITNIPTSRIPTNLKRVGFVCINCYLGTRYSLGDGPLNDGYNMTKCLKRYGFQVFYTFDIKSKGFLDLLEFFLKNVSVELVVYYVGHGTNVTDTSGDEADRSDEALVFVDRNIVDDELEGVVSASKNPDSKVVFVSDCCHSGSIWDIQSGNVNGRKLQDRIMSVSAANDKQTAKQTVADRVEQGMFTYNLMKTLKADPDMTATECKKRLATALRRYAQTVTIASTTPELLNEPLFLMN